MEELQKELGKLTYERAKLEAILKATTDRIGILLTQIQQQENSETKKENDDDTRSGEESV